MAALAIDTYRDVAMEIVGHDWTPPSMSIIFIATPAR